jgi:3-oxoacyl-[acyl-carrier protein] reductase
MSELNGSTAVVTGGSRGIGLAIARALAEGGARVAVLGRNGARAEEAARDLPGSGHLGMACDVADPEAARAAVTAVEEAFGDVAILVNNAGITRDNILLRLKDEDWDEVLDTNLKGAFNMTRAVTRGMMKRRDGVILNISSVVGLMGNAGQTNYAASKAGLFGLHQERGSGARLQGVRCNAVAPGYIETDMTGGARREAGFRPSASASPWGGSGPRRTWPRWPAFSQGLRLATLPGRSSRWMAEWSCDHPARRIRHAAPTLNRTTTGRGDEWRTASRRG